MIGVGIHIGGQHQPQSGEGSLNPEQGFDLALGTSTGHTHVGGDNTTLSNETGGQLTSTAWAVKSHPHNDTTLRYFEYQLTGGVGVNFAFVGYGLDAVGTFVGGTNQAAGYLTGLRQVRMQGTSHGTINQTPQVGDVVSVFTRGQRVWFGLNSASSGYVTTPGADPYNDLNPSKIITVTGDLRPLASCHYDSSSLQINTVGDFAYPPLSPAVAWDS